MRKIILVLLFLLLPKCVQAQSPAVSWVNGGATDARKGEQFDINVQLSNVTVGTTYHVRVYGSKTQSPTDTACLIDNLYNDSWSNGCFVGTNAMPYVIGSGSLTMRLRANMSGTSGVYYLYAFVPELNLTTAVRTVNINDPLPTATPTPKPTTTPTPTITPTISPTATLSPTIKPTITPTPTKKPTAIPTRKPTPTPTEEPEPTVEPTAEPTIEPTATPTPVKERNKKSGSSLATILIIIGVLMLTGPIAVKKIIEIIKKKNGPPPVMPPQTGVRNFDQAENFFTRSPGQ